MANPSAPSSPAPTAATTSPGGEEIRRTLLGGYPLIYLVTPEEERARRLVEAAAATVLPKGHETWRWSVATGLIRSASAGSKAERTVPKPDTATIDPKAALARVVHGEGPALFLFEDLHLWLQEREVVRWLREVYAAAHGRDRHLVLISPVFSLPVELRKDTAVVDLAAPTIAELAPVLDAAVAARDGATLAGAERTSYLRAIQGLTLGEAEHLLRRVLLEHGVSAAALHALQREKSRLVRKEGVLQFVPPETRMSDVGGLENLKSWLAKRRKLFEEDPAKVGDLLPRGLLMMGVSGCGKSLSVKAISDYWDLPLFRLDMNEVYSGAHGSPEESFTRALRGAEAFAPCLLWIDEIEGGITGYESEHGGSTWRIFSAFLTWMQEKAAPVFVAATANRIDLLPAEILRKGRFDQIFFLDLPSEQERGEIFRVHLVKRGIDCASFDLTILARGTKGWNGAEIEQCVVSAMVDAFAAGVPLTKEHIYDQLSAIVPLSTTMAEQIKGLRSWAHDRAIKAGK